MKSAYFFRKVPTLQELVDYTEAQKAAGKLGMPYRIYKEVTLPADAYRHFINNLLDDNDFIIENKKGSGVSSDGTWNCILVHAEGEKNKILVNCEGYDFARYTAIYESNDDKVDIAHENHTVKALRELSRKQEPGLQVLLPDDIKAGYHDVAELLHFTADMLE